MPVDHEGFLRRAPRSPYTWSDDGIKPYDCSALVAAAYQELCGPSTDEDHDG